MKLSIIVPTYNCRDYLDECLKSVLDQLWEDSELIVVDDGSDDGTDRMLERYKDNPHIKILICTHKGASGARNAGIEAASGEYIAFTDCDDCLKEGFLLGVRNLLSMDYDMIIFGFERCFLDGRSEISAVANRFFSDPSSFADEYIRTRVMLIYSACNKFYNKKIIDDFHIRFDTDMSFGEDRLFNYSFLIRAKTILTSERIMFRYMQRSLNSMSSRHYPDFFSIQYKLHEEKMKCFLTMSRGTSREERESFVNYDMNRAVINTIERFRDHPQEIDENLPAIARMIYGDEYGMEEEKRLAKGDIPVHTVWNCRPCDSAVVAGLI